MIDPCKSDPTIKPAVFIDTYGCQMNVLDSELVMGQLEALGYGLASCAEDAEVVLLNTCSVRALSEQKVWSSLGRLGRRKRRQPGLTIGVLGCMAEREGRNLIVRMPHVDVVCGPSNLDALPSLLHNARQNLGDKVALSGHASRRSSTLERAADGVQALDLSRSMSAHENRFQAYVRITRGCNKFCSFCVVPFTRGPEVHRPPQDIIDEVRRLVAHGTLEVTLLGQTVNHYHCESDGIKTNFARLLQRIHDEVPELMRLRFITSYPRDFTDEALDVMAQSPRICPYLHIPAQSGSNSVLRRMNRGYTVEAYMDLLARARARMPNICVAGDMIVGFPGETDADHQASLSFLKAAKYKSAYIFKYSPRPNTVASRRLADDVPEEVKKERNLQILQMQNVMSLQHHQALVGRTLEVLVESESKLKHDDKDAGQTVTPMWTRRTQGEKVRLIGRTPGDEIVAFAGSKALIGKVVYVRGERATPLTITGSLLGDDAGHAEVA